MTHSPFRETGDYNEKDNYSMDNRFKRGIGMGSGVGADDSIFGAGDADAGSGRFAAIPDEPECGQADGCR